MSGFRKSTNAFNDLQAQDVIGRNLDQGVKYFGTSTIALYQHIHVLSSAFFLLEPWRNKILLSAVTVIPFHVLKPSSTTANAIAVNLAAPGHLLNSTGLTAWVI